MAAIAKKDIFVLAALGAFVGAILGMGVLNLFAQMNPNNTPAIVRVQDPLFTGSSRRITAESMREANEYRTTGYPAVGNADAWRVDEPVRSAAPAVCTDPVAYCQDHLGLTPRNSRWPDCWSNCVNDGIYWSPNQTGTIWTR